MDLLGGLLIAMWNYMGWDNASTIATEVDKPQRNYPSAMLLAVALAAATYILPFTALWLTGFPAGALQTGSWADVAALLGGQWLQIALVVGGMVSAFGMFNALVMSYSRLPLAMAQDGMLPKWFAWVHPRTRAPWVSILALSIGWALCLGLGFNRLITLDILLYGLSLSLEFVALAILRIREPNLPRPFRVPGGFVGAVAVGVFPVSLLVLSVIRSQQEQIFGMNAFWLGAAIIVLGLAAYPLTRIARRAKAAAAAQSTASEFFPE
jgi:amino acid transporter